MATGNTNLPDELRAQVEAAARAQNRTADDLVSEAVQQYIEEQRWQRLVESGTRRAQERGLSEDDVPRLVEEMRTENQTPRQ